MLSQDVIFIIVAQNIRRLWETYLSDQVQHDVDDVAEAEEGSTALQEERAGMSPGGEAVVLRQLLRGGRDGDADQQLAVIAFNELEHRLVAWKVGQ